jgi:hypothetical protein
MPAAEDAWLIPDNTGQVCMSSKYLNHYLQFSNTHPCSSFSPKAQNLKQNKENLSKNKTQIKKQLHLQITLNPEVL